MSTITCSLKTHVSSKSKYDRYSVPIELFLKDSTDPGKGLFKTCLDCRLYDRERKRIRREKMRNNAIKQTNEDHLYFYCQSRSHFKCSIYSRDKVPKKLFRQDPEDSRSRLYKWCIDCRQDDNIRYKGYVQRKILKATSKKPHYCGNCLNGKDPEDMAINLDGRMAKLCIDCKELSKCWAKKRRAVYNKIKLEFIYKYQCSCQKCKCIYLKPNSHNKPVVALTPYLKDECLYIDYNNKSYPLYEFLNTHENLLEIRIIQLDHLTEEEQRKRGLLLKNEKYQPKVRNVSNMGSEYVMRNEARKCQHLCLKCHIIETMSREKGTHGFSISTKEKKDYVNEIKLKYNGCSICGFLDKNLLRFLHMDHINVNNKTGNISEMVTSNIYNMNDIIKECKPEITRILCGHCHIINTHFQRETNIVKNVKRKIKVKLNILSE